MARDTTPAYVVEVRTDRFGYETPAAWNVRRRGQVPGYGAPTDANLARYVTGFEASTEPGGVNAHLGVIRVLAASIRRNGPYGGDRTVLATYTAPRRPPAPLFTVVAGGENL